MSIDQEHESYGDSHHHDGDDHGHDDHDDDGCGCPDCDTDLIDDLKCQAKGIAAQAAYNALTQPDLEKATTDYATARTAYRTARSAAVQAVEEQRHKVQQLLDRIRCQINQDDVVECLDRAYRCVCRQLDKCGDSGGCCSPDDDCSFDKTCPDDYDELITRIAEYQARLDREKACFTTLIGEPAALTARVAAVAAEIAAIEAALSGTPATTPAATPSVPGTTAAPAEPLDLKKQYAATLVARRHLDEVWNGFARTQDYVDCLCRARICWTKASDAVSVLTGCKAVKDCERDAREQWCVDLRTKTVEEVMMEYERLCAAEGSEDDGHTETPPADDSGYPDDAEDDDPPCGCRHGHTHRRSHHEHAHRHDNGEAE
jgi:hypothetical protein